MGALSSSLERVYLSVSVVITSLIFGKSNANILDIGADSGRDVKHIAQVAAQTQKVVTLVKSTQ